MKKRFGKKALSFFVAMLMLLSVIPSFSLTVSATSSDDCWKEFASSDFTASTNPSFTASGSGTKTTILYTPDSDIATASSSDRAMKWTYAWWNGTSAVDDYTVGCSTSTGLYTPDGYIALTGYTDENGNSTTPITGLDKFKIDMLFEFASSTYGGNGAKTGFFKISAGDSISVNANDATAVSSNYYFGHCLNGTLYGNNSSNSTDPMYPGSGSIAANTKYHYIVTYDGENITVELKSEDYSTTITSATTTPNSSFTTDDIKAIRFGTSNDAFYKHLAFYNIKFYKYDENQSDPTIEEAIAAYESKMDGSTVYTNMQEAYDAYVACKQYLLTVDPEKDPTVSTDPIYQKKAATLASNLTTAINNMEEFKKPTTLSDTSSSTVTVGSQTINTSYVGGLLNSTTDLNSNLFGLTSPLSFTGTIAASRFTGTDEQQTTETQAKTLAASGILIDNLTGSASNAKTYDSIYHTVYISNDDIVWLYDGSTTLTAPVTMACAMTRSGIGYQCYFLDLYLASNQPYYSTPTAYSGEISFTGLSDNTSSKAWSYNQSNKSTSTTPTTSSTLTKQTGIISWMNSDSDSSDNVDLSVSKGSSSTDAGFQKSSAWVWRYGCNSLTFSNNTLSDSTFYDKVTVYYAAQFKFNNTSYEQLTTVPQNIYVLNWNYIKTQLTSAVAKITDEDGYTKSSVDTLLGYCDKLTSYDYSADNVSSEIDKEKTTSGSSTLKGYADSLSNCSVTARTDVQTSIDTLKEAKAVVDEGIGNQTYSYKSWAAFMDKYNTMDSVYNGYRVSGTDWLYDASPTQASYLSTYASELSTAYAALAGVADYTNYDTVRAKCDTVDLSAYSDKGLATTMNTLGSSTDANTYDSTSTTGQAYCSDGSSDGSNVYKVEDSQTTVDDYTKALLTALNTPNTYNLTVNKVTNGTSVNDTENSKTGLTYGTVTELTVPNGTAAIKVTRENSYGTSSTYISIEDLTTYTVKVQSDTTVDFYITDTDTLSLEDKKVVTVYDLGGRPAVFYVDSGTTVTASDMTLTFSDGQTYTCPTAQYVTFSKFSCGTGTTTITEDTVIRAQGSKASNTLDYQVVDSTGYIALADGTTESNTPVAYKADDEITVTANSTTYAALGIKASTGTQYTVIAYADTSSSSALTFTFYGFPVDAFGGANNAVDLRFFTSDELAAMSCTSNSTTCTIKGAVTKLPISYGVGYGTASSPKNIYTMYCMMSTGYDNSTYPVVERGIVMSASANTSDTLIKGGTGVATLKSSSDINSSMYMATVKTSSSTVYARSYVSYTVKWTGTDGETYDLPMVQYGDVQTLTAK